jgi:hypothetical protein
MLFSPVYIECHPRPLASPQFSSAVFLPTDDSPLVIEAPPQSWSGDPDPVGTAHYCFKSFSCNTYGSSRKCCKQKTYGLAKSFRCNTYKKQGGTPQRRSDVQTCGRSDVFPPVPLQPNVFGATIRKGTRILHHPGKQVRSPRCLRIVSGHRGQLDDVPGHTPIRSGSQVVPRFSVPNLNRVAGWLADRIRHGCW